MPIRQMAKMTQTKKNNLWHGVQTGFLGLIFAGVGWSVKLQVEMKAELAALAVNDKNQDKDINLFRVDIGTNSAANARQDLEIQALLPENKKKRYGR